MKTEPGADVHQANNNTSTSSYYRLSPSPPTATGAPVPAGSATATAAATSLRERQRPPAPLVLPDVRVRLAGGRGRLLARELLALVARRLRIVRRVRVLQLERRHRRVQLPAAALEQQEAIRPSGACARAWWGRARKWVPPPAPSVRRRAFGALPVPLESSGWALVRQPGEAARGGPELPPAASRAQPAHTLRRPPPDPGAQSHPSVSSHPIIILARRARASRHAGFPRRLRPIFHHHHHRPFFFLSRLLILNLP